jgi:outer membrane protein assembly factor BamE (lipoprotein component of BamABCDE complex)
MKRFLPALMLIILTGCQTIYSRGQYIDDNQLSALMQKNMTKEQVVQLIGSPNLVPDYTPNTWYYAQRSMGYKAWFKPKVVSQRIVMIKFDHDKTSEVEVFNEEHIKKIMVVQEYTKSLGNDKTNLQRFVQNLGKFNKTKKAPKKQR